MLFVGIGDVKPGPNLLREKQKLVSDGYRTCEGLIEKLNSGKLKAQPGCTESETLESLILGELSMIRDYAGKACTTNLSP